MSSPNKQLPPQFAGSETSFPGLTDPSSANGLQQGGAPESSSTNDTKTYTCCGNAQYSHTSSTNSGSWTGTHENHNPWHQLPIMARAEHNALHEDTEFPLIEPLPTPPSDADLPSPPIPVGIAASENPPARPQNRRLSNAFNRVRRENLQNPTSQARRRESLQTQTSSPIPQGQASTRTLRPNPPSRAITESQHTTDEVTRATMFTMQYELNQTPQGARLMMTHQRPEEVDFALESLEMSPELRYLDSLEATEAIVWKFIEGEDVSHLL